ncbi:hypothetical protein DE146DRAFT_767539 [Phaeosphaeria sp. MPI-PUGE-AT-0046c]|nr:hypothetical protein DE146DRAFT_767539 [Phaeosphaeria sp. MPI-PUGE-AT-0046c]
MRYRRRHCTADVAGTGQLREGVASFRSRCAHDQAPLHRAFSTMVAVTGVCSEDHRILSLEPEDAIPWSFHSSDLFRAVEEWRFASRCANYARLAADENRSEVSHLDGARRAMARPPAETPTTAIAAPGDANRAPLHHDSRVPTWTRPPTTPHRGHPCRTAREAARTGSPWPHRSCWRGTAFTPTWRCGAHGPIWMPLPGTRRICSEQGRSPQGDRLFRPSAMKRNLRRRPASNRGSKKEMGWLGDHNPKARCSRRLRGPWLRWAIVTPHHSRRRRAK